MSKRTLKKYRPVKPVDHSAKIIELEQDLATARRDVQHGSTETWRNADRRAIQLIEAELAELRG